MSPYMKAILLEIADAPLRLKILNSSLTKKDVFESKDLYLNLRKHMTPVFLSVLYSISLKKVSSARYNNSSVQNYFNIVTDTLLHQSLEMFNDEGFLSDSTYLNTLAVNALYEIYIYDR